jgi:glutamate formiminotransferase
MSSISESTTNMDTDNKIEALAKSLGEALAQATNVPVYSFDLSEQIENIVDIIRNKLPAKSKQQFKDMSDSQLRDQIAEFLYNGPSLLDRSLR